MPRSHLDLPAQVREERSVRVLEHLNARYRRHPLNQPLRVVRVGGEHGDIPDDPLALDANDVDSADVAPDAPDGRGELAEHPGPVHDSTPSGEGEARGGMLDHGGLIPDLFAGGPSAVADPLHKYFM